MERVQQLGVAGAAGHLEIVVTADTQQGAAKGRRDPIVAHGAVPQELPLKHFAQLPEVSDVMARLEPEDAMQVVVYAAGCGDLQSRNGNGCGTFYLLPSDVAKSCGGSLVSGGEHVWLTEARLAAVRSADPRLAEALLRFRDVIDDAMLAGGDSKADLKMHVKVEHAKCDHRLQCLCSSDPSDAVCRPCPGSDASDATFEMHRVSGSAKCQSPPVNQRLMPTICE